MTRATPLLALLLVASAWAQDEPAPPTEEKPDVDTAEPKPPDLKNLPPEDTAKAPKPPKVAPEAAKADSRPAFTFSAEPPEPSDTDCWIRLTSGEWLKAELKNMRNGNVIIDSDKLGDQTLDFGDIDAMWVPRPHIWVDGKRHSLVGPAKLQDGVLSVRTDQGVQTMPRKELSSLVQGAGKEIHLWGFKANLGADLRIGNSEQLTVTGDARVTREGPVVRWTLGYGGSVGASDNAQSINWHKGDTKLDVFVNRIFYVTPASAEFYYDKFQNILARTQAGAGAGYRWEATSKVTWNGYLGGLFQNTRYITALDTGDNSFLGGGVAVAMGFVFEPNGDLDISLDWRTNLILNDLGQTSHTGNFAIDYEISGAFSVFTKVIYTRIEKPPTDADGITPKSDDAQFIAGISVSI